MNDWWRQVTQKQKHADGSISSERMKVKKGFELTEAQINEQNVKAHTTKRKARFGASPAPVCQQTFTGRRTAAWNEPMAISNGAVVMACLP